MARRKTVFSEIKKDHQTVKGLFSKVTKAKSASKKWDLYETIRDELNVHSQAEEQVIYPRLKEKSKTQDIGFESVEEHGVVKYLLGRIDSLGAESEEFDACIEVLQEVVEHHVKEEEGEMFKKMRMVFEEEELQQMADAFLAAKEGGDAGFLRKLVA